MFATSDMSRLTVAAPVEKLEEILRLCTELSCVHIEEYGRFEDGIGVGSSVDSEKANSTSNLLTKVQAVSSAVQAVNADGPMSHKEATKMIAGGRFLRPCKRQSHEIQQCLTIRISNRQKPCL